MIYLLNASLTTVLFYAFCKIFKIKNIKPIFYFILFLITFLFAWVKSEAFEHKYETLQLYNNPFGYSLSKEQREYYEFKAEWCYNKACQNLENVDYWALLIPDDIEYKKFTCSSIKSMMAAAATRDLRVGALVVLSDYISEYLIFIYENYEDMQWCLGEAQYYFECYELYLKVLEYDQR